MSLRVPLGAQDRDPGFPSTPREGAPGRTADLRGPTGGVLSGAASAWRGDPPHAAGVSHTRCPRTLRVALCQPRCPAVRRGEHRVDIHTRPSRDARPICQWLAAEVAQIPNAI